MIPVSVRGTVGIMFSRPEGAGAACERGGGCWVIDPGPGCQATPGAWANAVRVPADPLGGGGGADGGEMAGEGPGERPMGCHEIPGAEDPCPAPAETGIGAPQLVQDVA